MVKRLLHISIPTVLIAAGVWLASASTALPAPEEPAPNTVAGVTSHASQSEGGFCRSEVVPSGLRWIRLMDPIPRVKVTRDSPWGPNLPFGPEPLRLEATPHVTDRHDRLGFSLNWIESTCEASVAWDIAARFARVTKSGRVRRGTERTKKASLARVGAGLSRNFLFGVGARPAFYRADIEVVDRNSDRRAHYAQYFRVVERKYDVRLALDRLVYEPGSRMSMRLRNLAPSASAMGMATESIASKAAIGFWTRPRHKAGSCLA